MKAYLILEDGSVYEGNSVGAEKSVVSEIVFNTSMTGYLEVMTDPSYAGQAVVMTYPLIGNYGICYEDIESNKAWVDAFIVRELSEVASNFRNEDSIQNFLKVNNIPCITGIDTRDLTKRLREYGTMNGMIITTGSYDISEVSQKIKEYSVKGVVKKTSTDKSYTLDGKGKRVVLMDFGAKRNIAKQLQKRGCEVIVVPCDTTADDIIKLNPDGIMLSNGPGDPKENVDIIKEIKKLYDSDIPIFAICLGHQLMALATGADTYKLKYGHRGGNHPVKDLENGKTYISSQNHGYAVDESTLNKSICIPAFVNVNDNTNEGLRYINKNIFTVQYHPEACPGPRDNSYLFDKFIKMMED
ncbi:carbamoyl phosphate synthase small subunit [Lachnoanaerobaculum umeaense]|uniref:Carbamoyl phosphate synthase small chain n=1 Tax=Lachnoanaerobaculum umeaense TaxID=617123 RepID=A0A385Q1V6_9FIRM|nr:carbamoyl phosphate synthase small subunit [Lachnoanaerobaculum umeaense]AYA98523.1 carbamoyl phosphate synthase small subunit [Lachnoanaerobaculum umeaense]PZW91276.1 carbamoyl-phosphate synthase small subunit [Lachnoanaerobaculum umeaense]